MINWDRELAEAAVIEYTRAIWPECNAEKEYFRFVIMMKDFDSARRAIEFCGPLAAASGMSLAELGELITATARLYNITLDPPSWILTNAVRMLLQVKCQNLE